MHSCFHTWDSTGHIGLSRSIILPLVSMFTLFFCIKMMVIASQMIPACAGGGIFSLSKLAGKGQPSSQNLALLSSAPGSCCKLCSCFPEAEQKLDRISTILQDEHGAAAALPSYSQLLAQYRSWINTACCHLCEGRHRGQAAEPDSAAPLCPRAPVQEYPPLLCPGSALAAFCCFSR